MGKRQQPEPNSLAYVPLPVRLSPGSNELRYIYIRPHKVEGARGEQAEEVAAHTLFVAAIPARYDAELRLLAVSHPLLSQLRPVRPSRAPQLLWECRDL